MKIYIACLASYNNGVLHGRWIDASDDVEVMQEEVDAMLRASPYPNIVRQDYLDADGEKHSLQISQAIIVDNDKATLTAVTSPLGTVPDDWTPQGDPYPTAEEFAIHDSEGLGDLHEYAGLAEVARRVRMAEIADDMDIPLSIVMDFEADYSPSKDEGQLKETLRDQYQGNYDSWRDFAEEYTRECYDMSAVPDWLENHIDWESIARDWEYSGDFTAYRDVGLYIFRTQ